MSLKIDRVQLEIVIQQDQARQKMIELEDSLKKANSELRKIKKSSGENSDALSGILIPNSKYKRYVKEGV